MQLYDHQKKAVVEMLRHKHGYANFSEMGSGKTACAIVAANRLSDVERVLIVCPNSLKYNWQKEWKLWADDKWNFIVLDGSKQRKLNALKGVRSRYTAVVINYESLVTMFEALAKFGPDLVIADESHNLKNHKAKKTQALKKIKTNYKWIMTGTPTPNSPLDIWSQYDYIRPGYLGKSYYAFRSTYANVYTGAGFPMIKGYRNLKELEARVAGFNFRVTKDECMDLPEKVFQQIEVELKPKTKKIYKQMLDDMYTEIGEDEISASTALVKILRLQQITSGFIKTDTGEEKHVGDEKLDALMDLEESLSGEKFVVWTRFNHEIKKIKERLTKAKRKVYVLDGSTKTEDRQSIVDAFQTETEPSVIVANVAVGGVGITLTNAAYCVYYSRTYSLGDALQSEDRIHRSGQKRKCVYYDLTAKGTVDESIISALKNKQKLSDKITGDEFRKLCMGAV